MKENGLKANSLCVEITETVIERINEHFYLNIEQLRKQGYGYRLMTLAPVCQT